MYEICIEPILNKLLNVLGTKLPESDVEYFNRVAHGIMNGYRLNFIKTNLDKHLDELDRRYINKH